jgi:hypothetical protein
MDIIIEYCVQSKVDVYLLVSSSASEEKYSRFMGVYERLSARDCHLHIKGNPLPVKPNLVIGCDSDYLKKFVGLLIPPYVPERSNEFMELAFAGSLLETIKNRVVLERAPAVQPVESKPQPKPTDNKEDFSNWAFEV